MGVYLNPGNDKFRRIINSEIYIDKTGLILYTNKVLDTQQQNICVSRPRRFGKSMAANMLAAYYSRECESKELFKGLKIYEDKNFEKYLNKYDTIFWDMQEFLSQTENMTEMIELIRKSVLWELTAKYDDIRYFDNSNLTRSLQDIYLNTKIPFVIIIDEWDCIFREYKNNIDEQRKYLDFLRDLLKDKSYIHLAYMTGILPIKKYGTHSALNMFSEFSMTNPRQLTSYVGFTEDEVNELSERYNISLSDLKEWYDGYHFGENETIYSPKSVVEAVTSGICDTYWNQTETFEALKMYIELNIDGLKDAVISMMSGEKIPVNTATFANDMTTFCTKDDVLTLLIHLGYLGYDFQAKCVYIPNREVMTEYVNAISLSQWGGISVALKNSNEILEAIWQNKPEKVASGIEQAHFETSHIQYNDENALSYTISLALYTARNYYTVIREMPTGKGFADMVYIPKKRFADKPAIVMELKWNKKAEGAIKQIKEKHYSEQIKAFSGEILLVGINYDKKTKKHKCIIEKYQK